MSRLPLYFKAEGSRRPLNGLNGTHAALLGDLTAAREHVVRICPSCKYIGRRGSTVCIFCRSGLSPPQKLENQAFKALVNSTSPMPWHALEAGSALSELATDSERGLSATEAFERLARYGFNILKRSQGPSLAMILFRQINSPIVYVLLVSGALAATLGKALDGAVIFGAVAINGFIGFLLLV